MTEPYTFSDNLGYLLNRCAGQIAALFQSELEPYGVTLAQWGAMLAIYEKGAASPSDIAARVGIDRGATSRLIARMEANGLVERRAHAKDGRSAVLSLSAKAQANMPALIARSKAVNREVLDLLPEGGGSDLLVLLSQLLEKMQDD